MGLPQGGKLALCLSIKKLIRHSTLILRQFNVTGLRGMLDGRRISIFLRSEPIPCHSFAGFGHNVGPIAFPGL
jgi:hypothetical protein